MKENLLPCPFCGSEAEFDDDYDIKYWQPIAIPTPPNAELTRRSTAQNNELAAEGCVELGGMRENIY